VAAVTVMGFSVSEDNDAMLTECRAGAALVVLRNVGGLFA
jgi:hypothetical protein